MEIDRHSRGIERIKPLRQQPRQQSPEHVPGSSGRHSRVPREIDVRGPPLRGHERARALEDHHGSGRFHGAGRRAGAIGLHVRDRSIQQPRHFTGMRSEDHGALRVADHVRTAMTYVDGVRIHHDGLFGIRKKLLHKCAGGRAVREAGSDEHRVELLRGPAPVGQAVGRQGSRPCLLARMDHRLGNETGNDGGDGTRNEGRHQPHAGTRSGHGGQRNRAGIPRAAPHQENVPVGSLVRPSPAPGQEAVKIRGRDQLHVGIDPRFQLGRNANIDDLENAHILQRPRGHETDLGQPHRRRDVRGHDSAFGRPFRGIQAGGSIDRDHQAPVREGVDPAYGPGRRPPRRPGKPGPEHAIDKNVRALTGGQGILPVRQGRQVPQLDARGTHVAEMFQGIAADRVRIAREPDFALDTAFSEVPRRHERVSPVVAAPGDQQHGRVAVPAHAGKIAHDIGHARPGAVHQHLARHAELFDGATVHVPHLVCGDEFHAFSVRVRTSAWATA